MFDDLLSYYNETVVAAFVEYRDSRTDGMAGRSVDLRAALAAASALYHFREHLPHPLQQNDIIRVCADYEILGDVVNAAKHRKLDPRRHRLLIDAENIFEEIILMQY